MKTNPQRLLALALLTGSAVACSATSQDLGNSDPNAPAPTVTSPAPSSPAPTPTTPAPTSSPVTPPAPAFTAGVPFTLVDPKFGSIQSMWGAGPSDIWAVGDANGIAHYDGTKWSFFQKPSTSILSDGYALGAVWGTSATSAWAVGTVSGAGIDKAQVLHWTGSDWVEPSAKLNGLGESYILNGVWAAGDADVWTVGATTDGKGFAAHLHDGAWEKLPLDPAGTYFSVWGSDPAHVWIGTGTSILAYDGAGFTPVSTGLTSKVLALAGTSASDVWAFGTSGLARHWDGATWTTTPMGAPILFMSAYARSANDVYAVGQLPNEGSTVAHWNGTGWTRGSAKDGAGLRAVWGSANEVWAMGLGVLYHGK